MKSNQSIRVQKLRQILLSKFLPAEQINPVFNTSEIMESFYKNIFLNCYHFLEGIQDFPEIKFNENILEYGRFSVLLDESIHFNRYRSKTLRSPFYSKLSSFPLMKYRTYCRKYEVECLKAGTSTTYWTSEEAEKHFGYSQRPGDLGLSGSSGWKLRALKDFVTDIIARQRKIRLLRISVWDDIMVNKKLVKFNELLMSPRSNEYELILKHVERKVLALYADDF